MNKCLCFVFTLVLTFSLVSCDDDQYDIEPAIVERAWTGDVGMNADNGEPLFSTFFFGRDGFGKEYQYYSYDGALYYEYNFQWYWANRYDNNLVLDYGRMGISYMDYLEVNRNRLMGVFYLTDDSPGFDFELLRE